MRHQQLASSVDSWRSSACFMVCVCVYVRLTCVVALSAAHSQQPHPARADSFSHVGEVGCPHSHEHTPAATRRSSRNCSTPPAKHEGSPFLYYERESGMRQGVCFSSEMGVRYCSAGYLRCLNSMRCLALTSLHKLETQINYFAFFTFLECEP
jgi:hypothetical protein